MIEHLSLFIRKVWLILVIGLLLIALFKVTNLLLTLFAGMLLAILWRGSARWLSRHTPMSYRLAMPLVILVNLGLMVAFAFFIAPRLTEGIEEIVREAPRITQQLEEQLRSTSIGNKVLDAMQEQKQDLSQSVMRWSQLLTIVTTVLDVLLDVLLILVFALFLIGNPRLYTNGLLHLVPIPRRARIREVLHCLDYTLFRWFIGKIIDMGSIFVMTAIGLWLLDMPLILTFALIAFFFSFVPNIGPLISAIPPMAYALLDSPTKALYVGLLYAGIQLFESYFITPSVQKKASFAPPVLLLFVQFLMGAFAGILGLFLATPLLVTAMVLVKMLYIEDYLGDKELDSCNGALDKLQEEEPEQHPPKKNPGWRKETSPDY